MTIIEDACRDILDIVNDRRTDTQVFNDVARDRLFTIYNKEDKEFNDLLDRLEVSVDYNEISQVKKCVTKILSLLSKNRKILVKTLRRI